MIPASQHPTFKFRSEYNIFLEGHLQNTLLLWLAWTVLMASSHPPNASSGPEVRLKCFSPRLPRLQNHFGIIVLMRWGSRIGEEGQFFFLYIVYYLISEKIGEEDAFPIPNPARSLVLNLGHRSPWLDGHRQNGCPVTSLGSPSAQGYLVVHNSYLLDACGGWKWRILESYESRWMIYTIYGI
jgi:hypothetical protein